MLQFSLKSSSSGEIYKLKASRTVNGVRFTCSCRAGEQGQQCKHRVGLLLGDVSNLVSNNLHDIQELKAIISDTKIIETIGEISRLEDELEAAKRRLQAAKIALGAAMRG
jgi:hypothetical protein